MRRTPLVLGAALLLVAANGVVHGIITHRWTRPVDMSALARALERLPQQIGPWKGEWSEIDPLLRRAAEAAGALQGTYVNQETGQVLTTLVLCGRPGPMSVHMPEHCYAGLGYQQQGNATRVTLDGLNGETIEFRKLTMVRQTHEGVPEQILVYHGWNDGQSWSAPALPRLVFANARFLFKVYVTTPPVPVGADFDDPVPEFLPRLCQEIERCIAQIKAPDSSQ